MAEGPVVACLRRDAAAITGSNKQLALRENAKMGLVSIQWEYGMIVTKKIQQDATEKYISERALEPDLEETSSTHMTHMQCTGRIMFCDSLARKSGGERQHPRRWALHKDGAEQGVRTRSSCQAVVMQVIR